MERPMWEGNESLSPITHKELRSANNHGSELRGDPPAFRELQPQATAWLQPQK